MSRAGQTVEILLDIWAENLSYTKYAGFAAEHRPEIDINMPTAQLEWAGGTAGVLLCS
jgi:hypothetical protein